MLRVVSCTGLMKKEGKKDLLSILKYQNKKRSKVVVLINDFFFFSPLSVPLCPLVCIKWRDEPELVDRSSSGGGIAPAHGSQETDKLSVVSMSH